MKYGIDRMGIAPEINEAFNKFIKERRLAIENLTQNQVAEALQQAVASGDFMRHVQSDRQYVDYMPFREVQRLKARIKELELQLKAAHARHIAGE